MPSRNSIKQYTPDAYYHIYNRGVDKRVIFSDAQDYNMFLKMLRRYLDASYKPVPGEIPRASLATDIELLAYCLMPNHFHLLIYQNDDPKSLETLCRGLMTGYVMYFNKKYKRLGPLFQGRYKASLVDSDPYLQHISRYIHLNPIDISRSHRTYPYSSYNDYQHRTSPTWISRSKILDLFDSNEYEPFVDSYVEQFKARPKDQDEM